MAAVETQQHQWELDQFLRVIGKPQRVLEIGAWEGGTLWHWLELADKVVIVDDQMRGLNDWQTWALEAGTKFFWHWGDSRDAEIIERAQITGPYDLIFIDGAHEYDAVRDDWLNYSSMVAEGGLVAFHDIRPAEHRGHGVDRLWQEIKSAGSRTLEIVEMVDDWGGIGVWFAP